MAVLSENPSTALRAKIRALKTLQTIKDGKVTYQAARG
jgi:predicted amidohydrolase YtcJ